MRLALIALASLAAITQFASAKERVETSEVSATAIIREINFARQNPPAYADLVAEARLFHQIEHGRAVDEAIRFLKGTRPLPPLTLSAGMCRAAADHCAEQINGQTGHDGSDRSSPGDRINRYGRWRLGYGENISYGQRSARSIVVTLVTDDGVRSRGHRKNIFNPKFTVAGVGYGPHAHYGVVCTTVFAVSYAEGGAELVARNY